MLCTTNALFPQDPDVTTVSRIYTPKRNNVLLTVGLGQLNTELNLVDMRMNSDEVVEFVNSEVSKHVKNDTVIGNKFFPTGFERSLLCNLKYRCS